MAVRTRNLQALVVSAIWVAFGGCGMPTSTAPAVSALSHSTLEGFKQAILPSGGYSPDTVEVLSNGVHLRILVSDAKLAAADQTTRENAASAIVAAIEQAPQAASGLASVQEISIAIIHPATQPSGQDDTHTEDVLQFRKGPSGRFAHHIT